MSARLWKRPQAPFDVSTQPGKRLHRRLKCPHSSGNGLNRPLKRPHSSKNAINHRLTCPYSLKSAFKHHLKRPHGSWATILPTKSVLLDMRQGICCTKFVLLALDERILPIKFAHPASRQGIWCTKFVLPALDIRKLLHKIRPSGPVAMNLVHQIHPSCSGRTNFARQIRPSRIFFIPAEGVLPCFCKAGPVMGGHFLRTYALNGTPPTHSSERG